MDSENKPGLATVPTDTQRGPEMERKNHSQSSVSPHGGENSGLHRAFWTLTGNISYAFFRWGILVMIARLGSPELVGRFAIALAVVAPIMMFTSFELRQMQATDVSRHFQFGDFSSARMVMSTAGVLMVAITVVIAGFDYELIWIAMLLAVWRALEGFSNLCFGQFQQDDRLDLVGRSNLIRAVFFIVVFSTTLELTGNLVVAIATLALGSVIMIFTWDLPRTRNLLRQHGGSPWHARWHWKTFRSIFWRALPLGLVVLVASLEISMPRYFIHSWLGNAELGFFAALATTTMAMQTVVIAVNQSALTPLARAWAKGDFALFRSHMFQLFAFGVAFGVAGVVGGLVLGKLFLTLVFGPEYGGRNDLFVLLLGGFAVLIIVHSFQIAARAMQQNWWPLSVRIISMWTMGAACVLLIPTYKLYGAAWAVLIGAGVGALCSVVFGVYIIRRGIRCRAEP